MVSLWRDNKCREAAGHRSAASGQQENRPGHFRSHLCSESSPGRRDCCGRADRPRRTERGRGREGGKEGRVVGGLRGRTTASNTCPVLQRQYAKRHTKHFLCARVSWDPHDGSCFVAATNPRRPIYSLDLKVTVNGPCNKRLMSTYRCDSDGDRTMACLERMQLASNNYSRWMFLGVAYDCLHGKAGPLFLSHLKMRYSISVI